MRKLLLSLAAIIFIYVSVDAQLLKGLGDKAKAKINQRVDNKADRAMDKGLDEAENGSKAKNEKAAEAAETSSNDSEKPSPEVKASTGLKSYSKYDFVPGSKIVFAEDFSQDVVGEFPLKWNTDGSGEIVTIDKVPGKWLDLSAGTKYETPFKKKLPDNYTIEFDLLVTMAASRVVPTISMELDADGGSTDYPLADLTLSPSGGSYSEETRDRVKFTSHINSGTVFLNGKDQLLSEFSNSNGKPVPVHVAVWVQKQRFRAWVNGVKVYDLPKGLSPDVQADQIRFVTGSYGSERSNYQYYLSNIKIAEALPDTRSKLITEGKWSTNGILFDVNSATIKPSSSGVLKEIATMLNENTGVRVKIIGHTDSDGDDAKNLDLSKRRALAVKTALVNEFKLEGSGIETDGLGETKPVSDNKSNEGKALNRRVEFVKL